MRRIGTSISLLAALLLTSVPVLAQSAGEEGTPPAPTTDPGDPAIVVAKPPVAPPETAPASHGEAGWIASLGMKSPALPAMGVARRVGDRGLVRVETGAFGPHVVGSADLQATLLRAGPVELSAGANGTVHWFPYGVDGNSMTSKSAWGLGPQAGLAIRAGKLVVSGEGAIVRGRIGAVDADAIGRRGGWLPAFTLRVGLDL